MTFSGIDLLNYKTVEGQIIALNDKITSEESKAEEAIAMAKEALEKVATAQKTAEEALENVQGLASTVSELSNDVEGVERKISDNIEPDIKGLKFDLTASRFTILNLTGLTTCHENLVFINGCVALAGPLVAQGKDNLLIIALHFQSKGFIYTDEEVVTIKTPIPLDPISTHITGVEQPWSETGTAKCESLYFTAKTDNEKVHITLREPNAINENCYISITSVLVPQY